MGSILDYPRGPNLSLSPLKNRELSPSVAEGEIRVSKHEKDSMCFY